MGFFVENVDHVEDVLLVGGVEEQKQDLSVFVTVKQQMPEHRTVSLVPFFPCGFAFINRRRQPYGRFHTFPRRKMNGRNSSTLKQVNFSFLKFCRADIPAYFKRRNNKNGEFNILRRAGFGHLLLKVRIITVRVEQGSEIAYRLNVNPGEILRRIFLVRLAVIVQNRDDHAVWHKFIVEGVVINRILVSLIGAADLPSNSSAPAIGKLTKERVNVKAKRKYKIFVCLLILLLFFCLLSICV